MVTIGIPIYNAERFLHDAVLSVINQTFQDWKLILLDDGSTDNSLSIAQAFHDSRIDVISDGQNRGLVYRLNQLINICTTPYIARMDADDIMHPERLEIQLNIMIKNSEIDVLGTNAYSIDDKKNINGVHYPCNSKMEACTSFIHPTVLAKTDWCKEHLYDARCVRMEDAELWYRSKGSSGFFRINVPLLFYREFGNNYYKKYFNSVRGLIDTSCKYLSLKDYRGAIYWFAKVFSTILKSIIYYIFNLIGKEQVLIAKRSLHMSEDEVRQAGYMLNRALKY